MRCGRSRSGWVRCHALVTLVTKSGTRSRAVKHTMAQIVAVGMKHDATARLRSGRIAKTRAACIRGSRGGQYGSVRFHSNTLADSDCGSICGHSRLFAARSRACCCGSAAQNSVDGYEVDPSTERSDKGPHPIRIAQKTAHHQLHAELECVVAGSLWMPLEGCSQAFKRPGYIASIDELKRSLLA